MTSTCKIAQCGPKRSIGTVCSTLINVGGSGTRAPTLFEGKGKGYNPDT